MKKVQTQLIDARKAEGDAKQAELEARELADQIAAQKEKEITELQKALAETKDKEINLGEFRKALIHKFLQSKGFYNCDLDLCIVSMNIGQQDALTEVQKMYLEIKVRKKELE